MRLRGPKNYTWVYRMSQADELVYKVYLLLMNLTESHSAQSKCYFHNCLQFRIGDGRG